MHIKEIIDQKEWISFFNECLSPSFHQSWEWGEFQKKQHHSILRLGLYDNDKLQAIALVIFMRAKRGNFLFIPHGPITKAVNTKILSRYIQLLTHHLKKIAKKQRSLFIRIAPVLTSTSENAELFSNLGYKKAPIYIHAETMWALDITKSEDELLAGMRKTTRYLIRKAIKEGVQVEKSTDDKTLALFWNIYNETFTREHFSPYSLKYISNEFHAFSTTNNALFFSAKLNKSSPSAELIKDRQKFDQQGYSTTHDSTLPLPAKNTESKYLASALILYTNSTAFYHQGASIHSKIPAPYLLQWESIKEAKRRGCKIYNFYGIQKPGRTPKAWSGLTMFKEGFGGYQIDYIPTQDLILSPKYYLSYIYEMYLNLRRGVYF